MDNRAKMSVLIEGDRVVIECPKGLWSVKGKNLSHVVSAALHLYKLHEKDGLYADLFSTG
jgi:hypothetical protein